MEMKSEGHTEITFSIKSSALGDLGIKVEEEEM